MILCDTQAHAAIRADPKYTHTKKKKPSELKKWNAPKLTREERVEKLKARLATMMEDDE